MTEKQVDKSGMENRSDRKTDMEDSASGESLFPLRGVKNALREKIPTGASAKGKRADAACPIGKSEEEPFGQRTNKRGRSGRREQGENGRAKDRK